MVDIPIPNFNLYGESADEVSPFHIHIEEIEFRSLGQNWSIKPHRHGKLVQILCIFDSELNVQLDDEHHYLNGSWLITVPKGIIHSFEFKPDSDGVVITFSDHLLDDDEHLHGAHFFRWLFEKATVVELRSQDEQSALLRRYIDLLRDEFVSLQRAKDETLLALINLLLISIFRQAESLAISSIQTEGPHRVIATFRKLLEQNYKRHWRVQDYAEALNISTATLNRICNERLGTGAKAVISDRVITEAKRRLLYTQQPLDQIAYYLGFKDPAYFSRQFKQQTQITPKEYRQLADRN